MTKSLTYADAGVDIDKASDFVNDIKEIAKHTPRTGVMGEIGGFGGLFSLNIGNLASPVLVSSTDGVGTKLKIAFMTGKHDTIGIDLVAMCVNDIIVQAAKPLFFSRLPFNGKVGDRNRYFCHRRYRRRVPSSQMCAYWWRNRRNARVLPRQ